MGIYNRFLIVVPFQVPVNAGLKSPSTVRFIIPIVISFFLNDTKIKLTYYYVIWRGGGGFQVTYTVCSPFKLRKCKNTRIFDFVFLTVFFV